MNVRPSPPPLNVMQMERVRERTETEDSAEDAGGDFERLTLERKDDRKMQREDGGEGRIGMERGGGEGER